MFSKESIRRKFILQLVVASSLLIVVFSLILYSYIKISIFADVTYELRQEAKKMDDRSKMIYGSKSINYFRRHSEFGNDKISTAIRFDKDQNIFFEQYHENDKRFLVLYYPFNAEKASFIKIERDITKTYKFLNKILKSIIVTNVITIFLVVLYAIFVSKTMLYPLISISKRITKMNENILTGLDLKNVPVEFLPLTKTINKLIDRILIFVGNQKELFIGITHELKTPLTVMKSKNEVALFKNRDVEEYKKILKLNNQRIDEMNKMISNILEIGRQEGAHFENPKEIDLIEFLNKKADDFEILAKYEDKSIKTDINPQKYCIVTQPSLLTHIIQNFVQNAIKFSPKKGVVTIRSFHIENKFFIEVEDEGEGIDESKDLFAPFIRFGDKKGAGLGLFIAKGAADALGAKISISNRKDKKGTIASLELNTKNYCPLEDVHIKS